MYQSNYCPSCGFDNRSNAKFCRQCGASMVAASPPGPPPQLSGPFAPQPFAPPQAPLFPSPAANSTAAWLTSPLTGQRYPLNAYTTIGRGAGNTIVLPDSSVSTQHAVISENNSQWQINDTNSRNGTWINRARIATPGILHSGDEVMLGTVALRFETSLAPGSSAGGTTLIDPSQFPAPIGAAGSTGSAVGHGAPHARGRIKLPPNERADQPPPDTVRTLVIVIVTLTFIGALLSFLAVAAITAGVLICLGGAVCIPILVLLWAPFQLLFNTILGALKDDKPVTIVNFHIDDENTGLPMDITFARKHGMGGGLAQNDVVEVWGKQQGGAAIMARKVRVVERQGQSTSMFIPIKNPWPAWVLLIALAPIGLLAIAFFAGR
jgi:pSer/pThr/pTyr-binding forkhead associated (FHA) protein